MVVVLLMPHISGMAYILGGVSQICATATTQHLHQAVKSVCVCFLLEEPLDSRAENDGNADEHDQRKSY